MAGVAAVTVLWLLARVRFDDQPPINPVPSVLGQLNVGARFDALASEIDDLQARLLPHLLTVDVARAAPPPGESRERVAALRWHDDLALLLLPGDSHSKPSRDLTVQSVDAATRLAVVRVSGPTSAVALTPWTPRRAQQPRYLMSSDLTPEGVSLRPSYAGSLVATNAVAWPGTVWALPSGTDLVPGSFVFTNTGDFVGLVITSNGRVAIVPAATVFAEADRLLTSPPTPAGTIAVEVQALTEAIAAVTGSQAGVVVTSTARGGPGSGALMVGDVIEGMDGHDLVSREQWNARMSRLAAGETLALRVRRGGVVREISIETTPLDVGTPPAALGLALRRRAGIGAEVTGVQRLSAADRAGLTVGDLITLFGDVHAPTPGQIAGAFAALSSGDRVLVAVSRGQAHFVTVLGR
jgi:hypothetical protein